MRAARYWDSRKRAPSTASRSDWAGTRTADRRDHQTPVIHYCGDQLCFAYLPLSSDSILMMCRTTSNRGACFVRPEHELVTVADQQTGTAFEWVCQGTTPRTTQWLGSPGRLSLYWCHRAVRSPYYTKSGKTPWHWRNWARLTRVDSDTASSTQCVYVVPSSSLAKVFACGIK